MYQHTAGLMLVAQVLNADGRTARRSKTMGGGFRPVSGGSTLLVPITHKRCVQIAQDSETASWQIRLGSHDFRPPVYQKLIAIRSGWLNPHLYRAAEVVNGFERRAFHSAHPSGSTRSDYFWLAGYDILVAEVSSFATASIGPTAAPRLNLQLWSVRTDESASDQPTLVVSQTKLKECRISRQDSSWCTGEGSALARKAVRRSGLQL